MVFWIKFICLIHFCTFVIVSHKNSFFSVFQQSHWPRLAMLRFMGVCSMLCVEISFCSGSSRLSGIHEILKYVWMSVFDCVCTRVYMCDCMYFYLSPSVFRMMFVFFSFFIADFFSFSPKVWIVNVIVTIAWWVQHEICLDGCIPSILYDCISIDRKTLSQGNQY